MGSGFSYISGAVGCVRVDGGVRRARVFGPKRQDTVGQIKCDSEGYQNGTSGEA